MNHLNTLLQRRVNQIQADADPRGRAAGRRACSTRARSPARPRGSTAARRRHGRPRPRWRRASAAVDAKVDRVVGQSDRPDRPVRRTVRSPGRGGVTGRFGRPSNRHEIRGRESVLHGRLQQRGLTAIDAGIPARRARCRAGRGPGYHDRPGAIGGRAGRTSAAAAAARRPRRRPAGWPAPGLAHRSPSEQAAVAQFWDRATTAASTRSRVEDGGHRLGAIAPVRLGGGTVTGPLGQSGLGVEWRHQRDRHRGGHLQRHPGAPSPSPGPASASRAMSPGPAAPRHHRHRHRDALGGTAARAPPVPAPAPPRHGHHRHRHDGQRDDLASARRPAWGPPGWGPARSTTRAWGPPGSDRRGSASGR